MSRVWEKVMEKMLKKAKDIKGIKTVSTKAKLAALKYHYPGKGEGAYNFFKKIYFSNIKALLGFDQCQVFFSGATPLMEQTADYLLSLDIRICEVYGMSENCAF